MSAEKRKHARYEIRVTAEVVVAGEAYAAETRNLSRGGLALVLGRQVAVGTPVELTLLLTQDGIEDPHENDLAISSRAVWCRGTGPYEVGVEFAPVGGAPRGTLDRFLAELAKNTTPV